MTLSELIANITSFRPSEYTKDMLTQWVNEVEFMAMDQVISRAEPPKPPIQKEPVTVLPGVDNYKPDEQPPTEPTAFKSYVYDEDAERELLIPDQFNACYTTYVFAKIDFYNCEVNRYNMEAAAFENEWNQYASWYRRTHMPLRRPHATTTDHIIR